MTRLSLAAVALLLAGCATTDRRIRSAPHLIGCASADVQVVDEELHRWTYLCQGRRFHCGQASDSYNDELPVKCTEEIAKAAPAPTPGPSAPSAASAGARTPLKASDDPCAPAKVAEMRASGVSDSAIRSACPES